MAEYIPKGNNTSQIVVQGPPAVSSKMELNIEKKRKKHFLSS